MKKEMTSLMFGRERYQMWRKRNQIRLIDVANYCGCSMATISQWENNKKNISDQYVQKYNEFIENFGK